MLTAMQTRAQLYDAIGSFGDERLDASISESTVPDGSDGRRQG